MAPKKLVGIFSREHQDLFNWLICFLLTISRVKDVRPIYISNNFNDFQQEAFKCNFAILYHSKNRGRVNVTDVTDSLYDKELEYLYNTMGKEKVLVVIDHLEDSGDEIRLQILEGQPSIGRFARQLFLFSTSESSLLTASGDHLTSAYLSHPGLRIKLETMEKLIAGKTASKQRRPVRDEDPHNQTSSERIPDAESGDLPTSRLRCLRRPICVVFISIIVFLIILAIVLATTLPGPGA